MASNSKSLEDLLRSSVKSGRLNHISISPDAKDPMLWCVIFRDTLGFEPARYFYDRDPVEALRKALHTSGVKKHVKRVDPLDDII